MAEFKWIIFSLFLMLPFSFSAPTWSHSFISVRAGEEVTLSCASVTDDQDKCDNTTWVFRSRSSGKPVMNFKQGQNHKEDRLSVTQKCSLVIKKVTDEDVGAYTCKQDKTRTQQQLSIIYLSVVTMTEHKNNDQVTFNCSVSVHPLCGHTVKWLYEGKDVDENRVLKTSKSNSSATVTFLTSYLKQKSKHHELFKCEVTDVHNGTVHQFTFNRHSSGDAATANTTSPTTIKSTSTARNKWTSVKMSTSGSEKTTFTTNHDGTKQGWWWWFIIAALFVAALFIFVVAVVKRKRAQENKTQMDQNTADPEGGVSYASISYTKKPNREAQVVDDDDDDNDEGDTVTYSTVKASSGSL